MSALPDIPEIADTDRVQTYTITSATTTVDLSYPLFGDATDIDVFVDGELLSSSFWSLSSISGTPIADLPLPITDGRITFDPALTNCDLVIRFAWQAHTITNATGSSGIGRREFDLVSGALTAGQRELRSQVDDHESRLIGSEAVVEARAAAEAARDLAQDYASNSVDASGLLPRYASVASLLADTDLGYSGTSPTYEVSTGIKVWAGAYIFEVAASGASDHHATTAGGVKLYRHSVALHIVWEGTVPSYRIGNLYGTIDPTVNGSIMFDGYSGFPNKLGVNNTKPVTEPATGARTADSSYVAGDANLSSIGAGYDNVNNGEACHINSQHSMIYSGATHCRIDGGSLHTIHGDVDYSGISDGTSNTIEDRCNYGSINNSDQCKLVDDGSVANSGFRGTIFGSSQTEIWRRNTSAFGCIGVTVKASYSLAVGIVTSTISAGSYLLLGGANLTIGDSATPSYSIVWGEGHTVNGGRSLVVGDSHTVAHDYANATGTGCVVPFIGARVHGSRQRGGTDGNNMALDFQCSQETTDGSTVRLSVAGSSTYPTQPENSTVTGTFHVTGSKDDGTSAAYVIHFSSVRVGTGTPTIKGLTSTELFDDLTITDPTVVATSGGIFRVQVVGLAATNIRWDARFTGQLIVWG